VHVCRRCWYFLDFHVGGGARRGCVHGGGWVGAVEDMQLVIGHVESGEGRGEGLLCGGEKGGGGLNQYGACKWWGWCCGVICC
jgi:hypothetical protein